MPILIDMKIFYALLKMSYGASYAPWHVDRFLLGHPLMYGVWHPYKYSVEMTYEAFMPIVEFLEQGWVLKVGVVVPLKVKLCHMETTIVGLLLATAANKAWLDSTTQVLLDNYRDLTDVQRVGVGCLPGLKAVLYCYCPALLALGVLVRECNWNGRTPSSTTAAKECIAMTIVLLMHMIPSDKRLTTEYLRTNSVALLFSSDWHCRALGSLFSKEYGEAILIRLLMRSKEVGNAQLMQQTSDIFLTLSPTLPGQKDCAGVLTQKSFEEYTKNVCLLIQKVSHAWFPVPVFKEDKYVVKWLEEARAMRSLGLLSRAKVKEQDFAKLLRHSLSCLIARIPNGVGDFLNTYAQRRSHVGQRQCNVQYRNINTIGANAPKPPPKQACCACVFRFVVKAGLNFIRPRPFLVIHILLFRCALCDLLQPIWLQLS